MPSLPSLQTNVRVTAALLARISFGLALVCVGLIHYMTFDAFELVVRDGLGPLDMVGMVWAYLFPALLIAGGGLFAIGVGVEVAVWLIGIALGSIAPGMLMKSILSSLDMSDMMAAANNSFAWLTVFLLIVMNMKVTAMEKMVSAVQEVKDEPKPATPAAPAVKPAAPTPAPVAAGAPAAKPVTTGPVAATPVATPAAVAPKPMSAPVPGIPTIASTPAPLAPKPLTPTPLPTPAAPGVPTPGVAPAVTPAVPAPAPTPLAGSVPAPGATANPVPTFAMPTTMAAPIAPGAIAQAVAATPSAAVRTHTVKRKPAAKKKAGKKK
jgi:hypothetical protein